MKLVLTQWVLVYHYVYYAVFVIDNEIEMNELVTSNINIHLHLDVMIVFNIIVMTPNVNMIIHCCKFHNYNAHYAVK